MSGQDFFADEVDFALAAYRDQGVWEVVEIDPVHVSELDEFITELHRFPSEVGVLGMVSINDEFFVLARIYGGHERLLLSDASVIDDWPLAFAIADRLDLLDSDDTTGAPAGDLALLDDLGVSAMDLAVLLDDEESYPEDVLAEIAERLGFGEAFEGVLD